MRVTNNMLVNTLLRNVNRNMRTMQKKQDQLATGKRVSAPSDDPVAVSKILKYKTKINELEQYDRNSKDALSWTQTSELAITDISNALQRARELAVQGANGTNTLEERKNIAEEIKQLKDHIIGNANKTFAGKYIFSSFQTDEKLLNKDGTFNIDITQKEIDEKPTTTYEVGVGETMQVSTSGLDIFGAVLDTSYFPSDVPSGSNEGNRGTQARLAAEGFNRTLDYTGESIEISITYDNAGAPSTENFIIPLDNLDGSDGSDITNQELIDEIKNFDNGSFKVSDLGNVTMDAYNNLIIEGKDYGTAYSVEYINESSNIFNLNPGDTFNGTDLIEASISGTNSLNDADIAADTSQRKLIVEYFGETQEITIDMTTVNTVGAYTTELNNKLDTAFSSKKNALTAEYGGAYDVQVSGNPLTFQTVGSLINGQTPSLKVKTIKSQKPQMMEDLDAFITALESDNQYGIDLFIGKVDTHLENINASRSEIGAKTNRLEMILNRIDDDNINMTQLLSNNQDVDMAETIMLLKNAENVYKSSLSAGARVIQPSLLDFLR